MYTGPKKLEMVRRLQSLNLMQPNTKDKLTEKRITSTESITENNQYKWLTKRSTDFKELSPCSVWYPLKTGDFDFNDIATYTCYATNGVGTGKSNPTNLQVIGSKSFIHSKICTCGHLY
jgi:hypothetical protein